MCDPFLPFDVGPELCALGWNGPRRCPLLSVRVTAQPALLRARPWEVGTPASSVAVRGILENFQLAYVSFNTTRVHGCLCEEQDRCAFLSAAKYTLLHSWQQ